MANNSKAYGDEGGFSAPVDLSPGDYDLQDGQVISIDGPANLTLPLAKNATIGIIIHCKGGDVDVLITSPDSIAPPEYANLTKDQAIQYSPVSSGWIVV